MKRRIKKESLDADILPSKTKRGKIARLQITTISARKVNADCF